LATWERLGYVTRLGAGSHQLGLAALELARKIGGRNRLTELSQSILRRLQSQTGESVYLGIYRKGRVILVNAFESRHPLRVVIDFGEQCHLQPRLRADASRHGSNPNVCASFSSKVASLS